MFNNPDSPNFPSYQPDPLYGSDPDLAEMEGRLRQIGSDTDKKKLDFMNSARRVVALLPYFDLSMRTDQHEDPHSILLAIEDIKRRVAVWSETLTNNSEDHVIRPRVVNMMKEAAKQGLLTQRETEDPIEALSALVATLDKIEIPKKGLVPKSDKPGQGFGD